MHTKHTAPSQINPAAENAQGSPHSPADDTRLLTAAIVVAFILAFSRWGTNLGYAPLFISDVLIAASVVHLVATSAIKGTPPKSKLLIGRPSLLFSCFFTYFIVRFVLSLGSSPLLDWVRDGMPFVYGALAFLSGYSLARSSHRARQNTLWLFKASLIVHLLWVALVSALDAGQGFDVLGPMGQAPLFHVRPDIDVAFIAVAAGLSLRSLAAGRRKIVHISVLALATFVVLGWTSTRAGQLSLLLCVLFAWIAAYVTWKHLSTRRAVLTIAAIVLGGSFMLIFPQTEVGERMMATIAPHASGAEQQASALGTQRARELTWTGVMEWTNEENLRTLFGVGFGPDFLHESGTLHYLEGTTYENVRSPHNWFVGIYARLGAVGAALVVAWVIQMLHLIVRYIRPITQNELYFACSLIFLALLPVATFGVVLEAPFGAIPFFWAAGILMAIRPQKRRHSS